MDGIFKQKLLGLRSPGAPRTFGEALLGDTSWFRPEHRDPLAEAPATPAAGFSERAHVLESLERFAVERAREENTPVLKVPGGEVHVQTGPAAEEIPFFGSAAELRARLRLDSRLLDLVLRGKVPGAVQVLFVSERFRPWEEVAGELAGGGDNELLAGFPAKTAELFGRMIAAMKLAPDEVLVFPVEGGDEVDFAADVLALAAFYRPAVVVTLGATATARVLKSGDRLSLVHGQFFPRNLGAAGTVPVVPLFHPSIIETNQNMKKTAWADMQKIMRHLKKLP
jgi:hypothetical protein